MGRIDPSQHAQPIDPGQSHPASEHEARSGLVGESVIGPGVIGKSRTGRGVQGLSHSNYGVSGDSQTFAGVRGTSVDGTGTEGWSTHGTGIFGTTEHGVSVHGKGGRLAGLFEGDVEVTGDVRVSGDIRLSNADCAEDFAVADLESAQPGTVMIIGERDALQVSQAAYDRRVVGVVAGAAGNKPGIVLGKRLSRGDRKAIALLGTVYCKVDADYGVIDTGDILTTSPTEGHAMKAKDPLRAFGAVIGKALRPHKDGRGLIPVLVALQ